VAETTISEVQFLRGSVFKKLPGTDPFFLSLPTLSLPSLLPPPPLFPSIFFLSPSFHPPLFPPLPSLSLPLEVGPFKYSCGVW